MQQFNRIVFRDEDEEERVGASEHNKAVVKSMARNSPLSTGMLVIVVVMFVVCVVTDMSHGKWVFPSITADTLIAYGANYSVLVRTEH